RRPRQGTDHLRGLAGCGGALLNRHERPSPTNKASDIRASYVIGLGTLWISLAATSWAIPGNTSGRLSIGLGHRQGGGRDALPPLEPEHRRSRTSTAATRRPGQQLGQLVGGHDPFATPGNDRFSSSNCLAVFDVTTKPCWSLQSPVEIFWLTMPMISPLM